MYSKVEVKKIKVMLPQLSMAHSVRRVSGVKKSGDCIEGNKFDAMTINENNNGKCSNGKSVSHDISGSGALIALNDNHNNDLDICDRTKKRGPYKKKGSTSTMNVAVCDIREGGAEERGRNGVFMEEKSPLNGQGLVKLRGETGEIGDVSNQNIGSDQLQSIGTVQYPLLSLIEWPGQSEGEAMDLDHFWNVMSMSYPEDHPQDWVDCMTVPLFEFLDIERQSDILDLLFSIPPLGASCQIEELSASMEEKSYLFGGTERDKANLLDIDRREQFISTVFLRAAQLARIKDPEIGEVTTAIDKNVSTDMVLTKTVVPKGPFDSGLSLCDEISPCLQVKVTESHLDSCHSDSKSHGQFRGEKVIVLFDTILSETIANDDGATATATLNAAKAMDDFTYIIKNNILNREKIDMKNETENDSYKNEIISLHDCRGEDELAVVFDGCSRFACHFKIELQGPPSEDGNNGEGYTNSTIVLVQGDKIDRGQSEDNGAFPWAEEHLIGPERSVCVGM